LSHKPANQDAGLINAPFLTHEVIDLIGIDQEFEIPPHAVNYSVKAKLPWFPKDGELLAVVPHMHLRGSSFRLFVESDASEQVLLDVPRYDFNWQHSYVFKEPLQLAAVESLHFTAAFDNSGANPVNPDPSQRVTWGDQTWEEMAVAFFAVSQPRDRPVREAGSTATEQAAARQGAADAFVARFLARFDADHDGLVQKAETPISFRTFAFGRYDADRDGRLTDREKRSASEP
jgi:hypothetical protein